MRMMKSGTRESSRDAGKGRDAKEDSKRPVRRKVCKFCSERVKEIDYRDTARLGKFTSERGKILPRRISGTCTAHQRQLAWAIKRARVLALMPFIAA